MSIIENAKSELALINFGEEDSRVMVEILKKFLDQWDSGGAVYAVAPVLMRCIAGKPLSPLTGADDEWVIHDMGDNCYAQNKRCGSVFKHRDGRCFDIDGVRDLPIAFPYWPERDRVRSPVVTFEMPLAAT